MKTENSGKNIGQNSMFKVPLIEKIAYGSGDVACNISYGVVTTLLALFYTDYAGISPATVGMVMLVSRFFDGFSDAIMGFIVSHTKSKWGQSRPWILWMSLPFCISTVILFTVPIHSSDLVKLVYVFITYNFNTTVCYTAMNLPYGSLSAMLTRDSKERDLISVFRMAMSPFGRILVGLATMPMVKLLGNDTAAFAKTAAIWSVVAFALLIFCFVKCEEKVVIPAREVAKKEKVKGSGKKTLKALLTNQYFWAVSGLWILQNSASGIVGIVLPYYSKYVMHSDTKIYALLYNVELFAIILTVMICPIFMRKFGKRNVVVAGAVIALVAQGLFILNPTNLPMVTFAFILRGIGAGPLNACVFGMLNDAVEFGQWKSGLRQEAYIFSAGSIGSKIGPGLTSAIVTGLLSASGYISSAVGGAAQPASAIAAIIDILKYGPLIVWVLVLVIGILYKLDKKYDGIMADLAEREARGEM